MKMLYSLAVLTAMFLSIGCEPASEPGDAPASAEASSPETEFVPTLDESTLDE